MKFDKASESQSALMFKALSHPIRIWIIKQLAHEEHCVSEFVKAVNVEFATISRHLAKLKRSGLIASRKQGREIWYRVNRSALEQIHAVLG